MTRVILQIIFPQYSVKELFQKLMTPRDTMKKWWQVCSFQKTLRLARNAGKLCFAALIILPENLAQVMDFLLVAKDARKKQGKEDNTTMITFNKQKDCDEFVRGIVKLSPEEFLALAKLFEVKLSVVDKESGEYTLRDAEEIINDCITIFKKMPHRARKELLKVVCK